MTGRSTRVAIAAVACALLVVALVLIAAPLITASAIKLWLTQVARENGSTLSYGAIEAPFLRPVTLRDVKIVADGKTMEIARIDAGLRLAAIFDRSRGRTVRRLVVRDIRGELRTTPSSRFWSVLLADEFTITATAFAVRSANVALEINDAELSASELQPGKFRAAAVVVRSPALQQRFADLRGGTSWEYDRLTIGGVTLMRGLDVDVLRLDLGQLSANRISIDSDIDLFGGKLRASMSADASRTWDIVASGSEISLGRMSDALGFADRTSGSLHALKFTFRGAFDALANATASLWAEVTGFTWRDRTTDVAMLGASYYSRHIDVEQLYVKQRANELTFSGEFGLEPAEVPALRGDLSATIDDLGEFARLFGGSPADFAGQLAINGAAAAEEQNLTGELTVSGKSLKILGAPIDAIDAHAELSRSGMQLDRCELRRDSAGLPPIQARGSCDFSSRNAIAATLHFDPPLALQEAPSGCVNEMRLAASASTAKIAPTTFDTLEFRGALFRRNWTVGVSDADEPARTFTFCPANAPSSGGALVIVPQR